MMKLNQIVLLISLLFACEQKPRDFQINNPVIVLPQAQQLETAVYLAIENNLDESLVLNYVHSPIAEHIEVHRHYYEMGKEKSTPVRHLTVKPGTTLTFKPGGYHLKLYGVYDTLVEGDLISITLEFERGHQKTVEAVVKRFG